MAPTADPAEIFDGSDVCADRLAATLRITKSELAAVAGLSSDAISSSSQHGSILAQARLREMHKIIVCVTPWAGSELAAYAWYCSQPLPSLGNVTAAKMVREGKAEVVCDYLERISLGGFA
ncbi:antitoxin Xre/MbcA/ParS toxin-binding domain-containing protein [Pacificimonas flava]|uniref:antitoxin Xre/MbcA/ParS toxin-binding domain-containing protein n=1 Tax=Pacificimonas flava TaxID=1234595 RepID=UPI00056F3B7B|nr:antitoxin Xre/MbcA/ParS toxin-binding domain-containing protein [Pacificimonas flava]MBB5281526.1 hypothetical protein [Pacificimonas flava]